MSSKSILTEGKVLDAAIAKFIKSVDAPDPTWGERMPELRQEVIAAGTETLTEYEKLFQKRAGVPNADWLNWLASALGDAVSSGGRGRVPPGAVERLRHGSDWLISTNRMNTFSFARHDSLSIPQLAAFISHLERDANDAMVRKNLSKTAIEGIDDADLTPAERESLQRRAAMAKGRNGTIAISMEGKDYDVVVDFGNGWQWQNLKEEYCKAEGSSMGHCGNAAAHKDGDEVLSLRRSVDATHWVPFATFIYKSETRGLGEMKGAENKKPPARLHPMIMALLTHMDEDGNPYIEKIYGGGHDPAQNFSMKDLTPEQRELVFEKNPDLEDGARDPSKKEYSYEELDEDAKQRVRSMYEDSVYESESENVLNRFSGMPIRVSWSYPNFSCDYVEFNKHKYTDEQGSAALLASILCASLEEDPNLDPETEFDTMVKIWAKTHNRYEHDSWACEVVLSGIDKVYAPLVANFSRALRGYTEQVAVNVDEIIRAHNLDADEWTEKLSHVVRHGMNLYTLREINALDDPTLLSDLKQVRGKYKFGTPDQRIKELTSALENAEYSGWAPESLELGKGSIEEVIAKATGSGDNANESMTSLLLELCVWWLKTDYAEIDGVPEFDAIVDTVAEDMITEAMTHLGLDITENFEEHLISYVGDQSFDAEGDTYRD